MITVEIPSDLWRRLQRLAKRSRISAELQLVRALEHYLALREAPRRRPTKPVARYGLKVAGTGLVPKTSEQIGLSLMARLRRQGLSYAAIAAELERRRIPTKRGGRWHAATVMRALKAQDAGLSASGPAMVRAASRRGLTRERGATGAPRRRITGVISW